MNRRELNRLQGEFEAARQELNNFQYLYNGPGDPEEWITLDRVRLIAKQNAFRQAADAYEKAIRKCIGIKLK